MKNIRFVLALLLAGCFALYLNTCAGPLALNGIDVTPVTPNIPAGVTQKFTATGYFNDQTSRDMTLEVTWSSSDPSVATIDSNGLATAVAAGTTTIKASSTMASTYSASGSSGSTTLTVNSATLSSIVVTPAEPSIPVGATQQFTATGTYSDGTSYGITRQLTWDSSDASVATIDSNGLATAIAAGTTTITATSGGISGNTTLTATSN